MVTGVQTCALPISAAEADKLLVTLDPLAALAETDGDKLDALMREVQTGSDAVAKMLEGLAVKNGIVPADDAAAGEELPEGRYKEQFGVIVVCDDEAHQQRVYDELSGAGHNCRVVVT